ncbi:VOC family protein [Teredinibacter turnerae]|uniref:VOC family protein n=1 Tax=Teredinibacter turnerae TaxID=2426 RepID=UPI001E31E1B6|nr:VOC family protein [Teredinibacter turnerae]
MKNLKGAKMNLSFHIDFDGRCEEAFHFYAEYLDAKIGLIVKIADSPLASTTPENWQSKILHGNIHIQGIDIAGADVQPDSYVKPQGFSLLLGLQSEAQVKSVFNQLSCGGKVILPPQNTFWSPCYAIVIDRFNVPWKLNCAT